MTIMMEEKWEKITEEEYHILNKRGKTVKKSIKIPDDVQGIMNIMEYYENPTDADYEYFKSVGCKYVLYVNSDTEQLLKEIFNKN